MNEAGVAPASFVFSAALEPLRLRHIQDQAWFYTCMEAMRPAGDRVRPTCAESDVLIEPHAGSGEAGSPLAISKERHYI